MLVKTSVQIEKDLNNTKIETYIYERWINLNSMIEWINSLREKSDSPKKQILLLYIESELKKELK